ncbi:MAG: ATP synthase subunit gamma, mitochondrial, partial [Paramarteilia canceri]
IKSITNIQKITKSMKMVSSTKFTRAEQNLKNLSAMENICKNLINGISNHSKSENQTKNPSSSYDAVILMTSDKGLCGQIHSAVLKHFKKMTEDDNGFGKLPLITVGDRIKSLTKKYFIIKNLIHGPIYNENNRLENEVVLHFNGLGGNIPTLADASYIIERMSNYSKSSGLTLAKILLIYNRHKSLISFETVNCEMIGPDADAGKISDHFEIENMDGFKDYLQFLSSFQMYSALGVANCAELSSRINCMENSTKNAGELLDKMKIVYNRTRQAQITNELNEIIAGATSTE